MKTHAGTNPHLHASALAALIDLSGLRKMEVARRAGMTPGQLSDLLTGRRSGTSDSLRRRLADALHVDTAAITCPCPTHGGA